MKILVIALLLTIFSNGAVDGQDRQPSWVQSAVLLSPFVQDASGKTKVDRARRKVSCFDLVKLERGCGGVSVDFGTRVGVNRNLFKINGGKADQTRMVRIGKYEWTDRFTIPYIEPWPVLAEGERRQITVNASGGDGSDGGPGFPGIAAMNGDGSITPTVVQLPQSPPAKSTPKDYASADITEQVSSRVVKKDGTSRLSGYTPLVKVIKGNIYTVRVIDGVRDYYVLIRVDDVVSGDRVLISFIKFNPNPIP